MPNHYYIPLAMLVQWYSTIITPNTTSESSATPVYTHSPTPENTNVYISIYDDMIGQAFLLSYSLLSWSHRASTVHYLTKLPVAY